MSLGIRRVSLLCLLALSSCTWSRKVEKPVAAVTARNATVLGTKPAFPLPGEAMEVHGKNLHGLKGVSFDGLRAAFAIQSLATPVDRIRRVISAEAPDVVRVDIPVAAGGRPSTRLVVHMESGEVSHEVFWGAPPTPDAPQIDGFSPASGEVGDVVRLTGERFTGINAVAIGGVLATSFRPVDDSALDVTVPAGAITGAITVNSPEGTISSATQFRVLYPPKVTGIAPTSAVAGATVTISGEHFTGATRVRFHEVDAAFSVASDNTITATVPSTGNVNGPITVFHPDGDRPSSGSFTRLVPPTVTAFSPGWGRVGHTISVTGTHFTGVLSVRFNGIASTNVTVTSPTTLTAVVPPGATDGPIAVFTTGGDDDLAGFLVAPPPGYADYSFNGSGVATTAVGNHNSSGTGVAVQPDGKVVTVGPVYMGAGSNYDFGVLRHNADGTLDTTFGGTGKVVTAFSAESDIPFAVAVQPDGKILVAGSAQDGYFVAFGLARYNANGSLDPTFGSGGKVVTHIREGSSAKAMVLLPSGKIVVGGTSSIEDGGINDFALARYNPNGTLDPTFGTGGVVTTPVGSYGSNINGLAAQPDGKIVAVGLGYTGTSNFEFAVARYHTDGSLDGSFAGGKFVTPMSVGHDVATAVAIQPDGKVVVAGYAQPGSNNVFAIARYQSNGTLDTTFNGTGKVLTAAGNLHSYLYAVAIDSVGKIVVAGSSRSTYDDFTIARYNANGALDTTFGGTGLVPIPSLVSSSANALALRPDGRIFAAGMGHAGSPLRVVFATVSLWP